MTPAQILAAPRIAHNFGYWYRQSAEGPRRLILRANGPIAEMAKKGIVPVEGLEVVFWCDDGDDHGRRDDLFVVGRLSWAADRDSWVADVDENAFRHESELREADGGAPHAAERPLERED